MSHGGGSSVIESIYNGKVLIGLPISDDQDGNMYKVARIGCGINLGPNPTSHQINDAFLKVSN